MVSAPLHLASLPHSPGAQEISVVDWPPAGQAYLLLSPQRMQPGWCCWSPSPSYGPNHCPLLSISCGEGRPVWWARWDWHRSTAHWQSDEWGSLLRLPRSLLPPYLSSLVRSCKDSQVYYNSSASSWH